MQKPELPPVTDAHRLAAFELLRLRGTTMAQVQQDPRQSRVLEALAHQLRTREWKATQVRSVVPVRRCRPGVDGHPVKWSTQLVLGDYQPKLQADFPC